MSWVWSNFDVIWTLSLDQIALSIPPIILGFLISIPLGWLANRYRASRGLLLTMSGLLYTIPSLPLFIALPIVLGTGILDATNVVVALTIYAVAIMVRSSTDAFESVSPAVLDAATASGFAASGRALMVELPLAGPVLLAGLRVVAVSTVSLVSVGALIGVNNLGTLFTEGYRTDNNPEIVTGVVKTRTTRAWLDGLRGRVPCAPVNTVRQALEEPQVLARQLRLRYIHLREGAFDPRAVALISGRLAAQHACIPVRATKDTLALAMANPLDIIAIEAVEQASGRRVQPIITRESEIAAAIAQWYGPEAETGEDA